MFCSEHFTGKLDFFTSHFHYNLYLKWIISIISYILSLWNLFETKIVSNGALDLLKNLLYSSQENKFSITGQLTVPWVKSLGGIIATSILTLQCGSEIVFLVLGWLLRKILLNALFSWAYNRGVPLWYNRLVLS